MELIRINVERKTRFVTELHVQPLPAAGARGLNPEVIAQLFTRFVLSYAPLGNLPGHALHRTQYMRSAAVLFAPLCYSETTAERRTGRGLPAGRIRREGAAVGGQAMLWERKVAVNT
jgi:hypothetical protein